MCSVLLVGWVARALKRQQLHERITCEALYNNSKITCGGQPDICIVSAA
jgi:hypothetical protein